MPELTLTSTTDSAEVVEAALKAPVITRAGDANAPAAPETPAPPAQPAPETPAAEAVPATPATPAVPAGEAEVNEEGEHVATPSRPLTPTEKRINQLTRQRRQAERDALAAKEEAARLKGRLEALEAAQTRPGVPAGAEGTPQTPGQQATTVAAAEALPDNPADPRPKADGFETYEAFVEASGRWAARQEYTRLRTAEKAQDAAAKAKTDAETAQRTVQDQVRKDIAAFVPRREAFKKDHPDFDDVIADAPASPLMQQFIVQSPIGPAIMYHLGQHPDEADTLAQMTGPAAFVALGKLEARLEPAPLSPATTPPPAPAPPARAAAPPPITPVGGTAVVPATQEPSEYQAYVAKRRREQAAAQGRR